MDIRLHFDSLLEEPVLLCLDLLPLSLFPHLHFENPLKAEPCLRIYQLQLRHVLAEGIALRRSYVLIEEEVSWLATIHVVEHHLLLSSDPLLFESLLGHFEPLKLLVRGLSDFREVPVSVQGVSRQGIEAPHEDWHKPVRRR